jgi:hypothetical protein
MKVICIRKGYRFTPFKIYNTLRVSTTGGGLLVCLYDDEGRVHYYNLEKIDFLMSLDEFRLKQIDNFIK